MSNLSKITGYIEPTPEQLEAIRVMELKLKEFEILLDVYCQCEILKPFVKAKIIELSALTRESIKQQIISSRDCDNV
jgi:hypothetical protein